VDSIDELVLILKESEQSDMLRRIGYCRKKMMSLLRLLVAKSDVIKTLIKRGEEKYVLSDDATNKNNRPNVSKDVIIYLGDIQGNKIYIDF
jgi:magnesium transporter